MIRYLVIAVAALVFTTTAAAGKTGGSCQVTPSVVSLGQEVTLTANADVYFDFQLVSPSGIVYTWPRSPANTPVTYQYAPAEVGGWRMEVNLLHGYNGFQKKVIATCPFTVTA